ncbi:UDP-N-acetylglucosamine 2-epimerase [Syntrophothermus lipocalidus DSM 12680]|uniref:UDP-N-acetylglucosamine 2-epimerase (non-hydrolyzing) n=2 Tax=Syntrophothermus TaxID=129001 RepID=D7CPS5_SYNLT|nr:UDP-N-acetylglucosamine 2-epimerase [Syntrophothermus lipocalidus DSM 12680]
MRNKVMVVFGTRPEAIKMAPVIKALQEMEQLEVRVAVTAQHREMLDQVLDLFGIVPDYDLNLMRENQDLFGITSRVLEGMRDVYERERPRLVLVHGDTTTTFAAALAAFYLRIAVGHVEAGLRTRRKYSPFPEEMNRTLTGRLADLHFAPTETARANLLAEGVAPFRIWVTGNTVIDALYQTVKPDYRFTGELAELDFTRRIILVTTHRRENWGTKMRQIYEALCDILEEFDDVDVVFPVHKNPVVRDVVEEVLEGRERVYLIEPLDYEPFAHLMAASHLVMTDSGGLQEEAPSLGKPVLVLRDTTERPEAVEAGTVKLVGTDRRRIYEEAKRLLTDEEAYQKMARAVNPYGDGQAAPRIAKVVRDFLHNY